MIKDISNAEAITIVSKALAAGAGSAGYSANTSLILSAIAGELAKQVDMHHRHQMDIFAAYEKLEMQKRKIDLEFRGVDE